MDLFISKDQICEQNNEVWSNRASFADYLVYTREAASINHFHSGTIEGDTFVFWFGSLYEQHTIEEMHHLAQIGRIFEIDGSFVYGEISKEGRLTLCSEREGLIPVYYRCVNNSVEISTRQDYLQSGCCADDIDYSAVWDYLRYGLLIGSHTFTKSIRLLPGGSYLTYGDKGLTVKKERFFHHTAKNEEHDTAKLMDDLNRTFIAGIKKRIDRPVEEIAVFLSGGMDSRLVLAAGNEIDRGKLKAVSFGQPKCDEVDVAKKVADIGGNTFTSIDLQPKDHLEDAREYARLTNGSDMSAQSYIISAAKKISKQGITAFMTGSFLECHIGGTFLPETALTTKQKLSEYLPQNMKNVKCELFSEEELKELLVPGIYEKVFTGKTANLIEEAKKYDSFEIKDIIQSFIIDNRDKRLVLNREIVPSQQLDYINPCFDKEFLEVAARIPAVTRFKRKFYRDFFINKYPEFADVNYNNTTLPISAPFELWAEGIRNEYNREQMYVKLMQNGRKTYYPHFYSDMDGYSRYDESWKNFFIEMLLSKESVFIGKIIRRDKVEKMLEDHYSCKANYRKKLLNLASLELYFRCIK